MPYMPARYEITFKTEVRIHEIGTNEDLDKRQVFGWRSQVADDPVELATSYMEAWNNMDVPATRDSFIRYLFKDWSEKLTKSVIRWLANLERRYSWEL